MKRIVLQLVEMIKWFIRGVRRRVSRRIIDNTLWFFDQHLRRLRMKLVPVAYVNILRQELMRDNRTNWPECLITLTLASRQFGHRDNRLRDFLQSFLEMTEKPEHIEILIKVDDDDDLIFFHKIKRKYQDKINMRFLVSERGKGYADFYKYHASLLQIRNPSSRIWILQSEDAIFVLPKWDSQIFSALVGYPHDYFIATDCPFDEAISVIGPNPVSPVPVYWIRGDLFPIMGFGILRCTEEVAQKHPGWTSLGNSFNIDGFTGDILRRLWQRHQIKLHIKTPTISREKSSCGWHGNKERHELRSDTLIKFFNEENQKIRDEMVDAIKKCLINQGFYKDIKMEAAQ